MATSWQLGTSYHSRYSPFVMTTNSQYGNWFPDGGRGSIGRTPPVSRRTLGAVTMAGDKHQALTPVDIQQVVNSAASDPRDKFTSFMAKSGSARLAAMQDGIASPLAVTDSVQQTRRSANTPGNSPEPGSVAEYQSRATGSLTTQNRDHGSKADARDSRFSNPPGVVEVRPYVPQRAGSVTREARIPFNRSQTIVATPVNGAAGEPSVASREVTSWAKPTLERSQTFHGRPTTPYEIVTMRKNDIIPDSYQWRSTQTDAAPPNSTDTPTYVLASERGRHPGTYNAAPPAGNRAMYWLYGSRGKPGPVAANDYLFSRDTLDSQFADRQSGQVPNGTSRQNDSKQPSAPLDSPSRTADARLAAAAAASSQSATVNSWTALRTQDTPYVSTITVNTPRSADVGRVSRASGDTSPRAIASSKMTGAEKRSILKRTGGYDVGTYRVSGSVHLLGEPRLPPLSATSRTPSGRKRVTFNL